MYSDPRAKVVGLPTVVNESWRWPILHLRQAYWKFSVVNYPAGYGAWVHPDGSDISHCFGGDTTSGSRVYNASTLRVLLKRSTTVGSAWMVALDLEFKKSGGTALTCLTNGATLLHEESYLVFTALEVSFSQSHLLLRTRRCLFGHFEALEFQILDDFRTFWCILVPFGTIFHSFPYVSRFL